MIKFPTEYGIGDLRGDQVAARECYIAMLEMEDHQQTMCIGEQRTIAEIGLTNYRVQSYTKDKNKEAIRLQLDLVDEARAMAEQRLARYQNLMSKHYNTRVRHRDFQIGNLVLRKVMGAAKDPTQGKLGPNWEGPYRITSWQRKGTYHLESMDKRKLQHPWNTEHLRKYYQ